MDATNSRVPTQADHISRDEFICTASRPLTAAIYLDVKGCYRHCAELAERSQALPHDRAFEHDEHDERKDSAKEAIWLLT